MCSWPSSYSIYSSISLVPFISKFNEYAVYKWCLEFISYNFIPDSLRSSLYPLYSCETALFLQISQNQNFIFIFLDLQVSFDTDEHFLFLETSSLPVLLFTLPSACSLDEAPHAPCKFLWAFHRTWLWSFSLLPLHFISWKSHSQNNNYLYVNDSGLPRYAKSMSSCLILESVPFWHCRIDV